MSGTRLKELWKFLKIDPFQTDQVRENDLRAKVENACFLNRLHGKPRRCFLKLLNKKNSLYFSKFYTFS